MEWLEIGIDAPDGDTEALCTLLDSLGVEGLVIEDEQDVRRFLEESGRFWDAVDEAFLAERKGVSRVKFYLSAGEEGEKALEALRPALAEAGYSPSCRTLRDEDWENNWKQYYRPMEVGKRLRILPEWEPVPRDTERVPLRLDPGLIFGTGSHPTTRMCLEAMEVLAPRAKKVLDLGCGSGILAIAALLLGAGSALGCDIDEAAPRIAGENAALNGLQDRVKFRTADVFELLPELEAAGEQFDVVILDPPAFTRARSSPSKRTRPVSLRTFSMPR